jgi:Fe-S-cluster containining protein
MGTEASSGLPLPLFQQAEHWFRRAQASLLGAIPCGQGCCHCCVGIFPITRLDALELQRGLEELPPLQKNSIVARARRQITSLEDAYPTLKSTPALDEWPDQTIDEMVEQFADLPCPALSPDGACGIYTFRPMTCRTMGIPSESDGMISGACAVQTAIPVIRLSSSLRIEVDRLAEDEAVALSILHQVQPEAGHELPLPYGFV